MIGFEWNAHDTEKNRRKFHVAHTECQRIFFNHLLVAATTNCGATQACSVMTLYMENTSAYQNGYKILGYTVPLP